MAIKLIQAIRTFAKGSTAGAPATRMGYIPPAIQILNVTNLSTVDALPAGTRIGKIEVYPSDAKATLTDDNSGTLAVDADGYLVTTATPLDVGAGATQDFTVAANWYGQPQVTKGFVLNVTEGGIEDIFLSGGHTMASGAVTNTVVGALTTLPSGLSLTISAQQETNAFKIAGGNLEAGSVATDKDVTPTLTVTIRATRDAVTKDKTFTITLT